MTRQISDDSQIAALYGVIDALRNRRLPTRAQCDLLADHLQCVKDRLVRARDDAVRRCEENPKYGRGWK